MSILQVNSLSLQYSLMEGYAVTDVSFEVYEGEILALVGESGSGKTSLLRLMAGFEEPDGGELFISQKQVADRKRSLVPEKRSVGMVFQDYALFPHLTVFENIAYGLHHLKKQERKKRVEEVVELVSLQSFTKRYPYELSGGQQQRTALARALAPNPSIVLLDEPFSNLDDIMKDQVREDVREIIKQTGTTAIFVTHDTRDALSTADRIAVLKEGRIQQIGTPETVYNHPVNKYVASFFGKINLLEAAVKQNGFQTKGGFIEANHQLNTDTNVELVIRPEDIYLTENENEHFSGSVSHTFYFGSYQQILVYIDDNEMLLVKTEKDVQLSRGQTIHLHVNVEKINVLESST